MTNTAREYFQSFTSDEVATWSHQETLKLISAFKLFEDVIFNKGHTNHYTKPAVRYLVQNKMLPNKTEKQCTTKWKNLIRTYKLHLTKGLVERAPTRFPYYKEIFEILNKYEKKPKKQQPNLDNTTNPEEEENPLNENEFYENSDDAAAESSSMKPENEIEMEKEEFCDYSFVDVDAATVGTLDLNETTVVTENDGNSSEEIKVKTEYYKAKTEYYREKQKCEMEKITLLRKYITIEESKTQIMNKLMLMAQKSGLKFEIPNSKYKKNT